jgi:uncharacterized protein YndB with AHSA1/START domain
MSDRPSLAVTSLMLERLLPATPDAVYAAWTDPALLHLWISPSGHADAKIDLRVGGSFQIVMIGGGARIEHTGKYLDLDPPRLLRFTWNSPYTGEGPSVVTVVLEPEGDATRLVLTHERLPADAVASHEGGWGAMVDRLAAVLAVNPTEEVGQ